MHLDVGTVETRAGQHGPGGLLGDSRVANNIRGFFATRIGSALPDTGKNIDSNFVEKRRVVGVFRGKVASVGLGAACEGLKMATGAQDGRNQ